jgi:hypothetical protein
MEMLLVMLYDEKKFICGYYHFAFTSPGVNSDPDVQ